ncbi:MAG: AMP-binding protein [Alphaproteobacteria bacterium]|nr:AMP-binding protein [Alphaproteobacteria bacterium]
MASKTPPLFPGYREIPQRLNIAGECIDKQIETGFGDRVAFVHDGGAITCAALARDVDALARGMAGLGIARGMPVLIRLRNSPEFVTAFLALVKLGALPVLQNSLLGPEEVAYVLEHSEAQAAVTFDEIAGPLRDLRDRLPLGLIVARGDGTEDGEHRYEALMERADSAPLAAADTGADEPAFIVYTSGTTGRPKGIVHAHRWIVAQGDMNRLRIPPQPGEVALATGEWSFISALGHNVLFALRNGMAGAILEERASPENVLAAIERFRVTLVYSVATVYRRILAIEGVEGRCDLSSLRGCNATGEALEAATYGEWVRRFGCPIWEHYGVSEMQLVFGQNPHWPVRPGSVGKALPGTTVAVLDDGYNPLPPGEVGHLLIAADNPGFFLGYHRDPAKTAEVVHDGWYHTGDLAWADEDGYIWIAGRSDDCFKSRGIFISPVEVENALRGHPAVAEACVVPKPDAEIGNRIRAVLVLRDGNAASDALAEDIRNALKGRIAPYKVPQIVEFAAALPKSAVGKVLRRALAG